MYSRQNRGRGETMPDIPRDYSGNAFMPFPNPPTPTYPSRRDEGRRTERVETARVGERSEREECLPSAEVCDTTQSFECEREGECACSSCQLASTEERDCEDGELIRASVPSPRGLSSLFGGNIGLEELLLLGVIFLIFADEKNRDSETLICLLLILFI